MIRSYSKKIGTLTSIIDLVVRGNLVMLKPNRKEGVHRGCFIEPKKKEVRNEK
jgi:hypothetical protein